MKYMTIKKVSEQATSCDKRLLFCQFVDDFYRADANTRGTLIIDRPVYLESDPAYMTELACAAHRLSHISGLQAPEWVFDEVYTLKEKKYAFDTKNPDYQLFLEKTSPEEYSMRNLFYGEDVLKRR